MKFASDNTAPAHPRVMEALLRANEGYAGGYGADEIMGRVRQSIRDVFEAPEAAVYLVATGTAANALALATLTDPWGAVYCHRNAHIEEDECGAPEFYTGGAKLVLVDGDHAKMDAGALDRAIAGTGQGVVHNVQRGVVSLTNVTEKGGVSSVSEVAALCGVAKGYGLPVHLDGARFANAIVATNASPAEMTWRAGVDAVSFGGTKNGLLGVEAVVFFDPRHAWEFELRRKRAGHLFSKHRYLSAQMEAFLADGLWLDMARQANAMGARLGAGLRQAGAEILHPVDANMVFAAFPRAVHDRARAAGAKYYFWPSEPAAEGPADEQLSARLVCSWSTTEADVDAFLALLG
ncbi:threonine aldolase family protein [Anianabacter salinae]|uniref:threonine aldolase family protein n=1 Tax=Anianabacter salinae TaxID=2851023 RepID=UPI00225E17E4|nr:beta-eliminating lyase-related protein [Anianabacter salinae]MBV0911254.1 low specificity L-threonine aldolase [Anianabacter salinae]